MAEKTVRLPQFGRDAQVRGNSFDADSNTISIVWTTGASVRRYDYWDGEEYDEALSLEAGAVRLERLNAGAPFLDTHCSYGLDNVIGSVVPGSAKIEDGRGVATILLSKASGVADTVQKIREGVIRNISVGYWVHKVEKTESDASRVARWNVTDWEPLEISAVPIPADPGSQFRSEKPKEGEGPALRSCLLVTPETTAPARAPKQEARKAKLMSTSNPAAQRGVKPESQMTEEEKRLALLGAAERGAARAAGRRDNESDTAEDKDGDEERDADDADEENSADDDADAKDKDSDGERDGDSDDDADEDKDAKKDGENKRAMTAADVRKAAEAAVRADRIRGSKIREIAAQFGLPKLGERHADGETSVRAFKDLVLERLADRQKKRGNTTFAAAATPDAGEDFAARTHALPTNGRDFDKGAAEARALLGKKAA